MDVAQLSGWTPIRTYWRESELFVDWCHLRGKRFTDPFFSETIERCLRHPFNLLFRHQTPVELLGELQKARPGLLPSGFVFHASRCGSTLIMQVLAALEQNVVISEAGPIDSILRAHLENTLVDDERRLTWFRWMVNALGQPRAEGDKHLFIKFDSWHTLELPLIRRAFPEVPWIFVYRKPIEVLVSQLRHRGAHMIPGVIEPSVFGMAPGEPFLMPPEEYCARVLSEVCRAALEQHRESGGRSMLVNYEQLPGVIWSSLSDFFGVALDANDCRRMRETAKLDAKNPQLQFADDRASKNAEARDDLRRVSEQLLDPLYEELEAARRTQAGRV